MAQVPLARKLAFSASGLGSYACLAVMNAYLMYFSTDVALLGVEFVGLALGVGRIFDAVNDPIVGYFSDKTQTRWGRRRPWIAGAALPSGIAFALLFRPPPYHRPVRAVPVSPHCFADVRRVWDNGPDSWLCSGNGILVGLSGTHSDFCAVLLSFFNNIGTICGGFLPFLVARFADVRTGYAQVTVLFAGVAVLTMLIALFAPERPSAPRGAAAGVSDFWRGYRACLRNRRFRILLMTFLVMSLGAGLGQAVAVYALVYWLGFAPSEIGLLIPVYLGTACVALPFWAWLSGWIGKDVALRRLLFYELFVLGAAYFLIPNKLVVYAFMVAAGFGLAGFVLVTSLLADILDVDELDTGTQRAGVFLSFWTLVMKGATAAGPALVGWILAVVGYVPNVPQTPVVIETLRWLYGPVPGLFFVAGYFLFRQFSLIREHLSEIQAELARRRAPVVATTKGGRRSSAQVGN